MLKTVLCALTFFIFSTAFSQSYIRGVVTDESGKPIENASIYFNNTQIGTKSNSEGNFAIYAEQTQAEIVISCIGYETLRIQNPVHNTKYRVKMNEFKNTLNEVVIGQKVKNRAKWDAIFFRLLMGNDSHTYFNTKILNPEVIDFYYDGLSKKLTVKNTAPIEIRHPYLGHTLKLDLIKFEFDAQNEQLIRESTVFYEDKYRRSEKESIQVASNRAYYGSRRHFYAALANNSLKEEGFEIFQYHSIKNTEKEKALQRINQLKLKKILAGYQESNIELGSLIKDSDSLKYYNRMMFAKDYLSRTLDTLKASDIVKYNKDSAGFAILHFKDTILVKYNIDYKKIYSHTKYEVTHASTGSQETMLIAVDPQVKTQINSAGLSSGNNILSVGNMALSGLSQELPKDMDPTKPRFKPTSALLREP